MTGLFGGILGLIELLGGALSRAVLYVLMGKRGLLWITREGEISVGGMVIGLAAGFAAFFLLPDFPPPFEVGIKKLVVFGGGLLVGLALAWALETIRQDLDEQEKQNHAKNK
jgi:hypothetical protein